MNIDWFNVGLFVLLVVFVVAFWYAFALGLFYIF